MFIVFEGNECTGKSTQIKLLTNYLVELAPTQIKEAPEKNNLFGSIARQILAGDLSLCQGVDPSFLITTLAIQSELINYKKIDGTGIKRHQEHIIQSRSFLSTLVYAQSEKNINTDLMNGLFYLAKMMPQPDILFFLQAPIDILSKRLQQRKNLEIYDNIDSLEITNYRYEKILPVLQTLWEDTLFITIDSTQSIQQINQQIISKVNHRLCRT